ncbi:hypothetical protein L211DRAFT_845855 [Terfezia boudieri ATCC MYA-4762]|uniref:Uncharacterized protein n=1 Tax=Terfezia boudieri ATCC MYA-4762 TaxID=1051890 RepID=A0A3N4LY77_9PEZI|nr:hypothetical protein L211DRAFT_845855 [Terfezia boudieri ATCC MYA-4762]
MGREDVSMVSSLGSYTPTDLSRKTERTSVSVPDDGRAVTIHTNRRRRGDEANGALTATSHTSLLIEYFESGKRVDGVPTSRPSVRVKLTPSSNKGRSQVKSRDPTELSARESARRSSHSNRTSLPLPKGEDRLTLGEDRVDPNGRTRSLSGDFSSNLSMEDDDDSRAPIDVTIYSGESPSVHNSSGRYHETADIAIRTKTGRSSSKKKHRDSYGQDTLSPNVAKKGRSRSTSREYDDNLKPKLGRRRSRSLSQERISQKVKEKIEKLGGEMVSKSKPKSIDDNGNLKAPRRRRERSTSRKGEEGEGVINKLPDNQQYDPALLEAVEDSIRKLILPQLHELKVSQNKSKFDQALAAISAKVQPRLAVADDPRGVKSASMPDVSKPAVVLQPDFDKGKGQGYVVSTPRDRSPARGGEVNYTAESLKSDVSYSRAPGLGPTLLADGHSIHSVHSDRGEGVLLEPVKDVAPDQRLSMPPMPLDYPESNSGETRVSIRTEQDGLPYPEDAHAGMPGTGNSPRSRASSIDSLDSIGGRKIIREPESELAPSTLYPEDPEDRPHSTTSIDSGSRVSVLSIQRAHIAQAKPIVVNSPSQLSIPSISDTPSTKFARQRRKGKARDDFIGDADEDDDKEYAPTDLSNNEAAPLAKNSADWFAEQRELAQQKALLDPNLQRAAIEVRHMSAHDERSFEDMQSDKVRPGQEVYGISAFNPSLVSTPFAIESNVASIRDGMSNLSFQTLPVLSANNSYPDPSDPMPNVHHMSPDHDYDEVTNPSDIQGPISDRNQNWDDLAPVNISDGKSQVKDEGYASPGFSSPGPSAHPMGGIDDIMESDEYNSPHRGRHSRVGSGGSHGMPDQLYDSATGKGVERIQSKDIIALMDHLTVRDAQRNARDTEILITLVRSAAEMRNANEDLKKQLEQVKHEIIHQVDQNTERTVQKALIGPRPQPISAPRVRRTITEGPTEEEKRKSTGIFKKALKGLSMKSEKDLSRIEDMLVRLLDEVEGLRDDKALMSQYQQSILGTIECIKPTPPHTALDPPSSSTANSGYYTGTGPSVVGSAGGPSRQASGIKVFDEVRNHTNHRISPIEEHGPSPVHTRGLPIESPPQQISAPPTANLNINITSSGTTPTKIIEKAGGKRESNNSSIFPKISRWSETTASSGVRGFLRKGKAGKESEASMSNSEFDFWAESGQNGHQPDQFVDSPRGHDLQSPGLPPSSRGTDAPVNQATIRSSLEVKHPQPKTVYRHKLEQQAQELLNMNPDMNHSSPSLVRSFDDKGVNAPMSPMSDGYTNSMAASDVPPARPPKILEEYEGTPSPVSGPLKEKKSKERNRDRAHRKDREKDRDAEYKDKETRRRERQEKRERRERREREKENGGEKSQRSSKSKLKEVGGEYLETDFRSELDQVRPLFSHYQSMESEVSLEASELQLQSQVQTPVSENWERGKRKKYYKGTGNNDNCNLAADYDDYRSDGVQSRDEIFGKRNILGGDYGSGSGSGGENWVEHNNHNDTSDRVWFR